MEEILKACNFKSLIYLSILCLILGVISVLGYKQEGDLIYLFCALISVLGSAMFQVAVIMKKADV